MAKEILSATIEVDTMNKVRELMEEQKRPSQSNMVQILLDEAIVVHKPKSKKKTIVK